MVNLFKKNNLRQEEVSLEITIKELPKEFAEIMNNADISRFDGEMNIKYTFNIEYFNGIAERFKLIIKLIDEGNVFVCGDLKPLNKDICLIKELIEKLDAR